MDQNNRPLLSIIVPVYNVEKYLEKCLNSIINQTYKNLEIIVIDDGSPDSCPEICDSFADKDDRIKVIHQKNSGVSNARNQGLEIANGDWIGFVDSDDYLKLTAYENLITYAIENECDAAVMDFEYVDDAGKNIKGFERKYGSPVVFTKKEAIKAQFDIPLSIRLVMFNKIFKREILTDLRFDEKLKCAEDTLFLSQCLERTKKVGYIKQPLYMNVQREGSAMHGALKIAEISDSLEIHKMISKKVKIMYPDLYDYAFAYYIDSCVWKMRKYGLADSNTSHHEKKECDKYYKKFKKRIRNEYMSILRCKEIPWKLKIQYFAIGVIG